MKEKKTFLDLMRMVKPETSILSFRVRFVNALWDMQNVPESERCAPEDVSIEWNFGFEVTDDMTVGDVLNRLNN